MLNENVTFKLDGFTYQGSLHLEDKSFYLDSKTCLPAISYNPRKIVCYTGNQTYVFWKNSISSRRILPEFVIQGYESPCFL